MRGSKMSKMLWNEKKLILLAHGLSAEGAKADVKKHTRLTILPFCVIKSYSLFFSFWLFISFQYSNPSSYSCGPSLSYVLRCYTSISDGFFILGLGSHIACHIAIILKQQWTSNCRQFVNVLYLSILGYTARLFGKVHKKRREKN